MVEDLYLKEAINDESIDRRDGCISCGACWESCPEFFEQNPDGNFSMIVEKYRSGELGEGEAPEDLIDCVIKVSDDCPIEIIHVS
ncbi:4Fe-4S single cluster domain of Ferredoxin I [uncultured archaeon]|nr:4Fe-4S single cluster domain of Ferredoxin I [uncultured archaeon]